MTSLVGKANIGDKIEIFYNDSRGLFDVVGTYYVVNQNFRYVGIGLYKIEQFYGFPIYKRPLSEDNIVIEYTPNIEKLYKYMDWIPPGKSCIIHRAHFNPDQKCVDCKRPAPHAAPNLGELYLCSFCEILKEI